MAFFSRDNPFAKRIRAYCAFCKSQRRIYRKKRIGPWDAMAAAATALALMGLLFQDWDARAVLFFVAFLALAEIFIQLRWRMSVVCQHCGFDPVLYLKNPEAAAAKVKTRLEQRKDDPALWLADPLRIPVRRIPKENEAASQETKKGQRLSRQV